MTFPGVGERIRSRRLGEGGVSLIELLVAMSVFTVVIAGVAVGMGGALSLLRNNRNRSVAANLAAAEMDALRSADFSTIEAGRVIKTRRVGQEGIDYTIVRDAEWISQNATGSACDSPSGARPAYLRVTVRVSWPDMAGVEPVTSQTILSPPIGVYDPATGHLSVRVIDRTSAPGANHQVTVSGPGGNFVQRTTQEGCAFFAYLAPGSYTATVSTTGYVDTEGRPSPSQTTSVVATQITSLQFSYDRAATLQLSYPQVGAYVAPAGMPIGVANTGLQLGKRIVPGSGNPRLVPGLFPFASGYQVWAGACSVNDPAGEENGAALYPGAQRAAPIASDPGATTQGSVVMGLVDVVVRDRSGRPLPNVAVRASQSAYGCSQAYDLGSTDAAGMLRVGLPWGPWQLSAAGSQVQIQLDPTRSNEVVLAEVTA